MPSKTRQAGPDQNIDYTSYPTMIRSLVNKYTVVG